MSIWNPGEERNAVMKRQAVCSCVVMFVAIVIFAGCGEDELLLEIQDEVSDLQNEINLLGVKAESAGKENERLMNEIDQLQKKLDELSSADYVDPEEVSQLEEQISQLASDALSNKEGISQIDTRVTTIDGQISGVIDGSVITAEEIHIVNEFGELRAKLAVSLSGNPLLHFYGEVGERRIMLGTISGKPGLWMYDARGYPQRVELGVDSDGYGYLKFYDEDGEVGTTLDDSSLDTTYIDTFRLNSFSVSQDFIYIDDFSYGRYVLYITELDERPALVLIDSDGNILWSIPLVMGKQGSGFLLAKSGLVVTNHHVVEGSSEIEVVFPQRAQSMAAKVIGRDEVNDLAILQLIGFGYSDVFDTDIPYQIASSDTVNLGEEVFALGSPLAFTLGESTKVSTGTVSSINGLLQISNPIQPGNSGGPVFDSEGRLVGVVVSGLDDEYFLEHLGFVPQNVNFAIKSDHLNELITKLSEDEFDEITHRGNQLAGKSLEEQVEMLTPFMVVVKAR